MERRRYFAFLRAINVGGRFVSAERLRGLFGELGLDGAETFLASGNVVFEASGRAGQLERRIEGHLTAALGYAVPAFLRTDTELAAVLAHPAFPAAAVASSAALNVALLADAPSAAGRDRLAALASDIDAFHVHGREVYWLCRKKQSESTFSNAVLERTLDCRATLRGMSTLVRLAARYPCRPLDR
ncbi:MAG: DUF1697 domain-containing protein [bacterium]